MANRFWVGGSGTWNNTNTTNWATTSGGAGGASAPTTADNVFFDSNSGTAATITVDSTAVSANTTINKSDIILSLFGNATLVTAAQVLTFTTGTIQLNSYTLTVGRFSSSNSNARTIDFGTGKIVLTGNGTTIWTTVTSTNLTISGTPVVDSNYSGSTGTRTINGPAAGANTETQSIDFNITNGSDTVTLANALYKNINLTGFSGTFNASSTTIYGNLTIPSTLSSTTGNLIVFRKTSGSQTVLTNGITIAPAIQVVGGAVVSFDDALTASSSFTFTLGTVKFKSGATTSVGTFVVSGTTQKILQSTVGGLQATLSQSSGTVTATYLDIKDINATGGATWNARTDSSAKDLGNNTGWSFIYIAIQQILKPIIDKILKPIILN
jgi:hypothetical protein